MARPKPWLKMWVEWVDDPKMLRLSLAEQGAWWRLLTLAQTCMADGYLVKGNGAPLSLGEITTTLRITTNPDRKVFESMIETMTDQGSLHRDSNALVVTHFAERQALAASETPEARRDRVRRHREKHLVTENPLQEKEQVSAPPLTTPPYIEGEGEGEGEGECNGEKLVTRNGNSVTFEPALAKIATLYESLFGILTQKTAERLKDFVENYHGPVEWIDLAFAEAVKYKNRRWPYVEAILYTWQEKGGPHADSKDRKDERKKGKRVKAARPASDYRGKW